MERFSQNTSKSEKIDSEENKLEKPQIKEGVDFVFDQHPELAEIGTREQYSEYLNSVFPESKTKDIFYHSSKIQIKDFNDSFNERGGVGFWFMRLRQPKFLYRNEKYIAPYGDKETPVLVNIKNPVILENKEVTGNINGIDFSIMGYNLNKIKDYGYDAVTNDTLSSEEIVKIKQDPKKWNQYETVVLYREQIHILGSDSDIQTFQDFIEKEKSPDPHTSI